MNPHDTSDDHLQASVSRTAPPQRVAILGAGISALAAAQRLRKLLPDANLTIFEATDRAGGVIQTEEADGYLIEQSADNFLVNKSMPWAGELVESIGLGQQLIAPNEENRRALVVKDGQTYPVPEGFYLMAAADLTETWRSPLLTRRGRWRLWAERFIRREPAVDEESLTQFATRRVGQEAFDRLVQPLVSGIYSADPDKLSVKAALPKFLEMEQTHGSLTAGLRKQAEQTKHTSGARYAMFRTLSGGLQTMIDRLTDTLESPSDGNSVRFIYNRRVTSVQRTAPNGEQNSPIWNVTTEQGSEEIDAVISGLPAPVTARILRTAAPQAAELISQIEHVGIAVVCLGYRRDQIAHPLDAFGVVVPAIEKRDCLAISISSNKFPNRAPEGHVLLRVFLGGALRPDLVELSEGQLTACAISEAADLLQIEGNPSITRLKRWKEVTPQYHVGHTRRMEQIDAAIAQLAGLELAGNAWDGIGIPQCVRSGQAAAEKLVKSAS